MTLKKFYNIAKNRLFKLNRSITGKDLRLTLRIIKNEIPELKIKKITSGQKVFDWKVPSEWNVLNAYVVDKYDNRIIDFKKK